MTRGDIIRLNSLYKCPDNSVDELRKLLNDEKKEKPDEKKISSKEVQFLKPKTLEYSLNKTEAKDLHVKNGSIDDPFFEWPEGIVYYQFDDSVNSEIQQKVTAAIKDIEEVSCIKFKVGESKDGDVVRIISSNETFCSPNIGWAAYGVNMMFIHKNSTKGDIIHNLFHTLGFPHMHIVNNRDDHVQIQFDNIIPAKTYYFRKAVGPINMFNTSYDTRSIMHFSSTSFAKNTSIPTIIPKDPVNAKNMGQRESEFN